MSRKQKKGKSRKKHGQRNAATHDDKATVQAPPKQVGLFVTKELATAIEACKKKVESIAKECRAKNVRFRDREFDLHYDTFRCLHGYTEWIDCSQKDVQRVTEMFDNPHFFPEGGAITSNAIRQGELGDCYFLSALATVSCIPNLIEKICVARDEEVGVYGFIFYRDSGWVSIIIDDMLFTNIPKFEELEDTSKAVYHDDKENYNAVARKGGSILLFARAGSQQETWVPLIEKAYAKLYGNFAHLEGGFTNESVEDLTGGVSSIFISKDILDTERFWKEELEHVNKDRVFACAFNSLKAPADDYSGQAPAVEGLYGNHAYSILRAVEAKGKRFVVVRNPWGNGEWTGRWSDGSKEWTQEWIEVLPELGHSFGDDGQFVMEYNDFLRCFETIERTFLFDDTWVVSSSWMAVPLNDQPRAWAYGALSYLVTVPVKTKTILVLSRLNDRFFRSIRQSTMISLEYAVVRLGETEPLATACEYRPFASRSVTLELELEAGTYCVYVRFDREVKNGENQIGFDDSPQCDCCPAAINTSTRVISRIISNKVESQAIAENWDSKMKAIFIAKSLEQTIAEDLVQLTATLSGTGDEEKTAGGEKPTENGGESPSDGEKPTENGGATDGKQEEEKDVKKETEDSEKGNGTSTESNGSASTDAATTNSDSKPNPPGESAEAPDASPASTPQSKWEAALEIFTIGFLNILALFGLTLLSMLEGQPPQEGNGETKEELQNGETPEDNEGEGNDDELSDAEDDSPVGQYSNSSLGSPMNEWREMLKDDGKNIFLGLRVYTQTQEPALLTGRVKCEGPELCICSRN